MIAIPPGHASRASLYRDFAKTVPTVFVDARADPEAAFVGTDNAQSIRLVVDYLLRSGSPPSYFDMPDVNQNARERRRAYEAAMHEHGHAPAIHPVGASGWDFEQIAFDAASSLFRTGGWDGRTMLCANDRIAFGVMAAAAAGIEVGRTASLRIAGHDDHLLSRFACPSLTTVAQDGEELASAGLLALPARISGATDQSRHLLVDGKLMMRHSA